MSRDPLMAVLDGIARRDTYAPASKILHTRQEAAEMLSMSLDSFVTHVQPHVRIVRRGRMRLVPAAEIERWADANAEFAR